VGEAMSEFDVERFMAQTLGVCIAAALVAMTVKFILWMFV